MDDLELGSDEKVLAPAQMVHIKSASFEAVLTNKRIILVDRIKDTHPKKNILLTTIKDFEQGENTLHEKVITFTLLTTTGKTRQMVLTIDRQTVSDPGHKADEWVTALKNYVPEAGSPPVEKAMRMQVPGQSRPDYTGDLGELKKIEIARPIKDQDGHEPSATKPAEITSLTKGFFSSPARTNDVVPEGERADSAAAEKIPPAPVASPVPDDHKGRTLEQIIHSMGPIGGDAESLTESAPAVPESAPIPMAEPVPGSPAHAAGTFCAPGNASGDPCGGRYYYRDPCDRSRGIYRHERPAKSYRCPTGDDATTHGGYHDADTNAEPCCDSCSNYGISTADNPAAYSGNRCMG